MRFGFAFSLVFVVGCSGTSGTDVHDASGGSSSTAGGTETTGGTQSAGGSISTSGGSATGGNGGSTTDTSGGTSSTGGTSAGGTNPGSGGTGGSAPHTVGECNDLAPAGEWESLWPIGPGGADIATGMAVDPFDSGTVWATGTDQGIYKSTDCGSTWTHMNTGENGAELDSGGIPSLALDPVTPGVMYVTPIYGPGGFWKSTNGGVDWVNLIPYDSELGQATDQNMADSVSMDPTNPLHLVVGTHSNCKAPHSPGCQFETTDGGETFKIVDIPGGGWQEQAGPFVLNATSWIAYGAPGGLWLTTDNGDTWEDVQPDGAQFGGGEVENQGISIGKDGTYYITSYSGVVRSSDGHDWSIIPNSGGRKVGFTMGDGYLFATDQWTPTYHKASEDDPETWTQFAAPDGFPGNEGAPFIDYDEDHNILYTACFGGGLWRVVME